MSYPLGNFYHIFKYYHNIQIYCEVRYNREYMKNKLFISLIVIVIIIVGVYIAFSKKEPLDTPSDPVQISEGPITESGIITCIPKLGTGPQTMECALGLKNNEGVYYGLKYLSDHDENFSLVSPEITVEVTGVLILEEIFGPDGNKYDTVGTIEIETISEI